MSLGLSTRANFGIALGFGIPGISCTIALVCYVRRKINFSSPHDSRHHHHQTTLELSTAIVPQHGHVVLEGRSLDQSTTELYRKNIILGQNKRLPKPTSDDGTCPICLSEYRSKEALRTMPECNHYFHARCIDMHGSSLTRHAQFAEQIPLVGSRCANNNGITLLCVCLE
ncbi:hypothetical protein QQ045_012079 [Rhodiola kirilowii]